jgi:hypothetical protein
MTPNTITVILLGFAILVLLAMIRSRGRAKAQLAERNDELAARLQEQKNKAAQSEFALKRKVGDLEAVVKDAGRKIAGLQKQVLSLTSGSVASDGQPSRNIAKRLPPDGKEVFSPVLEDGRVYEITIEGTCALRKKRLFGYNPAGSADGMYQTDEHGAFSDHHEGLYVDDECLVGLLREGKAKMCQEDREAHRYSFRMKGAGRKVGISLRPYGADGAAPSNLALTVDVLPEGTAFPQKRISAKTNPSGNGIRKKKELTVPEYREQQRQREAAKTEDELAQMESAFERQQKILERFEAQIESLQKKAGMSEENKKILIAAFRAVVVETLKPPASKNDTSATPDGPKEPYVL